MDNIINLPSQPNKTQAAALSLVACEYIDEQRGKLYQALAILKCGRLAITSDGCDMDDIHRVLCVIEDLIETANTGLDTVEIERAAASDQAEVSHG